MQPDGNLVYYRAMDGAVRWQTSTSGLTSNIAKLTMQSDGNAVLTYSPPPVKPPKGTVILYKPTPTQTYTIWTSNTAGYTGARLVPQDDGNLVVYASDGRPVWNIGPDLSKQPSVTVAPPGGPPPSTLPSSKFLTCNLSGCQ